MNVSNDVNFIRNYLIFGIVVAYFDLLGIFGKDILKLIFEYSILGLVILTPLVFLPKFYESRRNGVITEYFNRLDIVSIIKSSRLGWFTRNVYLMICLCLYFSFIMHDVNLTMAGISLLILWRISYFMTTDVINEHLHNSSEVK